MAKEIIRFWRNLWEDEARSVEDRTDCITGIKDSPLRLAVKRYRT